MIRVYKHESGYYIKKDRTYNAGIYHPETRLIHSIKSLPKARGILASILNLKQLRPKDFINETQDFH